MQGKHSYAQCRFYFQGMFSYINKRGTFSPDCKHKHVLEDGAPPDKFGVLYRLLHTEFNGCNSRIDVSGLLYFVSWYYLDFLQTVCIPLISAGRGELLFLLKSYFSLVLRNK